MIKAEILGRFLVNWFLKSLRLEICKDATMMGKWMEEEKILRSQQLNLIYSQTGMIYNILPNFSHGETNRKKATPDPHANGVIGYAIG